MTIKLNRFTVRLAIAGIYKEHASEAVQNIEGELKMRPHLRNPQVSWESKMQQAIVQVDNEDISPESAAESMAEELLEVAVAVLREFKRIQVNILDVHPSSQ